MEYMVRDNRVPIHWKDQWCSGLLCNPDAHAVRVLMLSHTDVTELLLFLMISPFMMRKSVTHKHFLLEYMCH